MTDISKIRTDLSKAPSAIKQNNIISATKALRTGISTLISQSLMKSEQEEIASLIESTCKVFNTSENVQKLFPMELKYTPGQEKSLFDTVTMFLEMLEDDKQKEALEFAERKAKEKQEILSAGQKALDEKLYDEAREVFNGLIDEFVEDSALQADIAERYMEANLYDDAITMFERLLATQPNNTYVLNRFGIALRKVENFREAEKCFKKAIGLDANNPNLFFNLGRLYFEQEKWEEAIDSAEKAIAISPEFSEAEKLHSYCKKQLA